MSFPVSPTNGQIAVVNNVAYEYATANTSWTRVLSIANVIQANVISANVLNVVQAFSITGNIATGNYFIGNGAFLTGLSATYGNANVANYLPTYTGNLVSLTGPVTTTANVTANNVLFGTGVVSGTGTVYAATVSTTGNVNSGFLSTGPASTGNLISGGFVSASGNITGSYIFGNGALLTGVITSVSNINNGTSNVTVVSSGGNVSVGVGGTGNVAVFSTDAVTVKGNVLPSANITYDLGTSTQRWRDLWLSNSTIYLGNAQISANTTAVTITNPEGGTTVLQGATPTITATVISASGNVTGGNILTAGLISATGNVTGGNLSGTNIVGTLTTASQNNITSVGTLSSLTVTANATGGNLLTGGQVSAVGNVTGGNILGGANVNATTHTGTTVSVTANVTGGNILTAGLISATGNITGGNLITANRTQSSNIVVTGGITAPTWGTTGIGIRTVSSTYVDSTTANFGTAGTNHVHVLSIPTLSAANTAVTILTAATLYIAGAPSGGANGTLITRPYALLVNSGNVGVTANVDAGNLKTGGLISATANITGGNLLTGGLISATGNITGGNLSGTSIVGTLTTAAQPNITSVGTLTGLTINNATTAITNGAANGVGNIGTSANSFNVIFAKATSAQYADLAEMYVADADYLPGTVLEFGGNHEVTISNTAASALIAGVVSTNPAHLMNSTAQGKYLAAIALVGRVPTLVVGPVSKGAMMVSAGNGHAQACATPAMGTVIGKAVENFTGESGTIEIVVGRL